MRREGFVFLVVLSLAGCGGGSAPLPSADAARQALSRSLETWKAGQPATSLAEKQPPIEFVDFEWKAGKVLVEYNLGADSSGQGTHSVAASIKLKGEATAKDVKYMILGTDPVHIYRDEDYNRAMNMEDSLVAPKRKPRH